MDLRLTPHDPAWRQAFADEAAAIRTALDPLAITLHHIGSTAIPGILAKPIIDLLGEVEDPAALDSRTPAFVALGYEAMGAYGIPGRRYFRKITEGRRTHHLHVFARGAADVARHLAFRDYLIAHPQIASDYSALKAELTRDGAGWDQYIDGKDPFIQTTETRALAWARCRKPV